MGMGQEQAMAIVADVAENTLKYRGHRAAMLGQAVNAFAEATDDVSKRILNDLETIRDADVKRRIEVLSAFALIFRRLGFKWKLDTEVQAEDTK